MKIKSTTIATMENPNDFIGKSQEEVSQIIRENMNILWFTDKIVSIGTSMREYDEGVRYVVRGLLAEVLSEEESALAPKKIEEVPVLYILGGGKPIPVETETNNNQNSQ